MILAYKYLIILQLFIDCLCFIYCCLLESMVIFCSVLSITDVDNVLQRMTIVGVILCFRQLAQGALVDVLEERIPFLHSSILDIRHHLPTGDPMVCL